MAISDHDILYVFSTLILPTDKMAEDGETKVAKRGRGRPPKAEAAPAKKVRKIVLKLCIKMYLF